MSEMPSRMDGPSPECWEPVISYFEREAAERGLAPGGIVFTGSSTITRWDLGRWFPDVPEAVNRGFGGSTMTEAAHFARRIVGPLCPRQIVLYSGDNDIGHAEPHAPEQVAADLRRFVEEARAVAPNAAVLLLSIKPSPSRWHLWDKMAEANRLMGEVAGETSAMKMLDMATPMLGPDGRPREELYVEDKLHLSDAGYALWAERIRPELMV